MNTEIISTNKGLTLAFVGLIGLLLITLGTNSKTLSVNLLSADTTLEDSFEEKEVITPQTFEDKDYGYYLDEDGFMKPL